MHKAMYCTCGRLAHFPKHARHGYTWVCWSCGATYTIVPRGTGDGPLARIPSARPRRQPKVIAVPMPVPMRPQPVIVHVQAPQQLPAAGYQNPFMEPGATMPALPAPPRRGGLLAWLFGE